METKFSFNYTRYDSMDEMSAADRELVTEAVKATRNAQAPYSRFRVGAAAVCAADGFCTEAISRARSIPPVCAPSAPCSSIMRPTTPAIPSRRWPSPPIPISVSAIPAASAVR